ncbi:amidohydrolase family protein [Mycolicibacterium sp. S2-37]|uniref:amidohydrolase family protein n=1 Tax=Mycolicibacterium sp. S2-37 TaxID=2810297 RepID=UPI001A950CE4|nr:amidohydrolase family protein [Mycolicibacterium sp. S2-37]MBO0675871.1 amidohydrolase family protein [Mycolicibacterium sp. S2-37]
MTDQRQRVFDSHLHIIDDRYPLVENNGYLPHRFTVADYERRVVGLNIAGGAVVTGSFQGFDQTYLRDALQLLGPSFVGVTQIPPETPDRDIIELDSCGVRAVRFNIRRGGSATVDELDLLARRVHDLAGWHCELYIDSRDLFDLAATLIKLPRISIDHLGLTAEGMSDLLRLVDAGAYVKATGFGRIDMNPADAIRRIIDVNPHALVFGTDLPSTRADRPFVNSDLDLIRATVDRRHIDDVLWSNAATLYRVSVST